jgi:hypothetical protein
MLFLLLPASLIATGLILSKKARAAGEDPDIKEPARGTPPEIEPSGDTVDVRDLAASAGAPTIWQDFFAMTAYGESKFHPDVGLGIQEGAPPWVEMNISTKDAMTSCAMYKANLKWLAPCWPKEVYCFGSLGLFQNLPVAALAAFKNDPYYRCAHPWSLSDPAASMIYAVWFARRLQGWSNWDGTVLGMRAGWANPSTMHKPTAEKYAKWAGHCQSVGLPPSFLDQNLPRWKPAPAGDLWTEMGVDDLWLHASAEGLAAA